MRSIPLTSQEQHALGYAPGYRLVPRYDAMFRVQWNLWHLLTPLDLMPLCDRELSRELVISICAARALKVEISAMLSSPSREVNQFGFAVLGRSSLLTRHEDINEALQLL